MNKKLKGFTLVEIIITIAILGVIASFAIPHYSKAIAKARERDAIIQLSAIHSACQIYKTNNAGRYFSGNLVNTAQINSKLSINIIENNGTTYIYSGLNSSFGAKANVGSFTVSINERSLSSDNPCCDVGACPTLPAC